MNANELADALETMTTGWFDDLTLTQAATMLRQQQAEIERLIGFEPITYGMLTFCKNCGEQNPYPAKTLTDEEIMVLYEEYIETQYASESNVLGFGRAILRKAQEK
jgi:hypothetical protein